MINDNLPIQPTLNLGIVGHVDHGKTTLTKLLSGKWTDTHSEEKKRGITIKLGYTNFTIYTDGNKKFSVKKNSELKPIKKVSIVDAPGHESFMATMISGAAIMDAALLLIAVDEPCPQPQTIEHLKTLEIAGIKNIIIIQNKIDLVSKEEAIKNYEEIKEFLKGTIAENSPIIPMSAQHGANLKILLEYISKLEDPKRDLNKNPHMYIVRSFDINKPGDEYINLKGGVLGGTLKSGKLKINDEIEIRPGIAKTREGKVTYNPIQAKIQAIKSDKDELKEAIPGGSVAIMTKLDPFITKTDSLVGQIVGLKGTLPEPVNELSFKLNLFEKVITSTKEIEVKPIALNEPLMLIVNSMTTVGIPLKVNPREARVKLKRPVMAFEGDRVVVFRRIEGNKWRISGYGIVELNN